MGLQQTKRIKEIDFLYALGAILVILGHSHSTDWSRFGGTPYQTFIVFLYSFHMPLFFFISGYLLMHSKKLSGIGYAKWIGEKALRILVPYVFLTVIFLFPKMYIDTGKWFDVKYIVAAFLQPRNNCWGHLWFLPVLFLCFALFGLASIALRKADHPIFYAGMAALCIALYFTPINSFWLGLSDFREFAVFFAFGMIVCRFAPVGKMDFSQPARIAAVIGGFAASVLLYAFVYDYSVTRLVIAIVLIAVCYLLASLVRANAFCTWTSKHNFTLFLYSWPAQAAVMMFCDKVNTNWLITFFMMFFAGVIFPVVLILIYEKLPKIQNRFFDLVLGVK